MEDVVLNSGLVTDKTLLFPTSQHDQGDKPRSDWLCGDRAGFMVVTGCPGGHNITPHTSHLLLFCLSPLGGYQRQLLITYFTLLLPGNISV